MGLYWPWIVVSYDYPRRKRATAVNLTRRGVFEENVLISCADLSGPLSSSYIQILRLPMNQLYYR